MLLKPAIIIIAPSSVGSVGCVASFSATPKATAVPSDWPTIAIRDGGTPRVWMAQFIKVMPSVINPSSDGVPVERP